MKRGEFKIIRDNEYMAYIDEHIKNVIRAYEEISKKCTMLDWVAEAVFKMDHSDTIHHHDESKYSDEEFQGYRIKFYPLDKYDEEAATEEFDKAWKHHYLNNNHHWEFWVKDGVASDMTDEAIVEMVADWQGMSYKFGDSAKIWYEKQTDIVLSDTTRHKVEELLNALC